MWTKRVDMQILIQFQTATVTSHIESCVNKRRVMTVKNLEENIFRSLFYNVAESSSSPLFEINPGVTLLDI